MACRMHKSETAIFAAKLDALLLIVIVCAIGQRCSICFVASCCHCGEACSSIAVDPKMQVDDRQTSPRPTGRQIRHNQKQNAQTSSKVSSQPLQLEVNSSPIFLLLNHKYHSDTSIHAQGVPAQEHSPSDLSKDIVNHQRHSHKRNGINMGLQKKAEE